MPTFSSLVRNICVNSAIDRGMINRLTGYTTVWYNKLMKRQIVQTRSFERDVKSLISKRKLSECDFEDFKKSLAENPDQGDVIPGTGGIRKIRLKSSTKGKRGGFRVCYLNVEGRLILFLLFIYSKNDQENLSPAEKKELKQLAEAIKRGDI